MSASGKDDAIRHVMSATNKVSGFGDYGAVAKGLEAVAWAVVALAEALDPDIEP